MSRLSVEYHGGAIAISEYKRTYEKLIEFSFKPACDGYISIGKSSYGVHRGVCVIDASKIKDDEITPILILDGERYILPPLVRCDGEFTLKEYDDDFLRNLSLRELRNEKRLSKLEKEVNNLSKKVYHTTIF